FRPPRSAAGTLPIAPLNLPTAERTAAVMTTSFMCSPSGYELRRRRAARDSPQGNEQGALQRPATVPILAHFLFGLDAGPSGLRASSSGFGAGSGGFGRNSCGLCGNFGRRFLGHFDETALSVGCQCDELLRARTQLLAECG